jgi:hypothetical protein
MAFLFEAGASSLERARVGFGGSGTNTCRSIELGQLLTIVRKILALAHLDT